MFLVHTEIQHLAVSMFNYMLIWSCKEVNAQSFLPCWLMWQINICQCQEKRPKCMQN